MQNTNKNRNRVLIQTNQMPSQFLNSNLKQKLKIEDDMAEVSKYKSLWRAVILQALIDIKSKGNKNMNNINRVKAILWMNVNKKDFLVVCERAEIDPQKVCELKEKILNRQANNMKQRLTISNSGGVKNKSELEQIKLN